MFLFIFMYFVSPPCFDQGSSSGVPEPLVNNTTVVKEYALNLSSHFNIDAVKIADLRVYNMSI